jgi:hypothetical protein
VLLPPALLPLVLPLLPLVLPLPVPDPVLVPSDPLELLPELLVLAPELELTLVFVPVLDVVEELVEIEVDVELVLVLEFVLVEVLVPELEPAGFPEQPTHSRPAIHNHGCTFIAADLSMGAIQPVIFPHSLDAFSGARRNQ